MSHSIGVFFGCAGLWIAGLAPVHAQTPEPAPATSQVLQTPDGRAFLIGPDDTVTISVNKSTELSKAWRVSTSGLLSLPLVGRINAAGMTVEGLESELRKRLGDFFVDPQVTVYLSEFRSMPVTVTGAVERPGVIQAQGARGLFDVLMRAGGPRDPGETVTVTRRLSNGRIAHPAARESDASTIVELPLAGVLEGKGPAADLPIMAGDIISVSNIKVQRMVYIIGAVNKPGAVELVSQDKLSLLKLLALSGGFSNLASKDNTFIRHASNGDGAATTTKVNVSKVLKGKDPDVELAVGDMVVVPTSKVATYLQTMPQTAVTTGMLLLGRF